MPVLDDVVDLSVPVYEGMPTDDGAKFWARLSHAPPGSSPSTRSRAKASSS